MRPDDLARIARVSIVFMNGLGPGTNAPFERRTSEPVAGHRRGDSHKPTGGRPPATARADADAAATCQ